MFHSHVVGRRRRSEINALSQYSIQYLVLENAVRRVTNVNHTSETLLGRGGGVECVLTADEIYEWTL